MFETGDETALDVALADMRQRQTRDQQAGKQERNDESSLGWIHVVFQRFRGWPEIYRESACVSLETRSPRRVITTDDKWVTKRGAREGGKRRGDRHPRRPDTSHGRRVC